MRKNCKKQQYDTEEDDEVLGQYDVQEPHIIQTEAPNSNEENDPAPSSKKPSNSIQLPQIKSCIAFKLADTNNLLEGLVHSRAGKATGKYRYHLNIQSPKDKEIQEYDFSSLLSIYIINIRINQTTQLRKPLILYLLSNCCVLPTVKHQKTKMEMVVV